MHRQSVTLAQRQTAREPVTETVATGVYVATTSASLRYRTSAY